MDPQERLARLRRGRRGVCSAAVCSHPAAQVVTGSKEEPETGGVRRPSGDRQSLSQQGDGQTDRQTDSRMGQPWEEEAAAGRALEATPAGRALHVDLSVEGPRTPVASSRSACAW